MTSGGPRRRKPAVAFAFGISVCPLPRAAFRAVVIKTFAN